MWIAYWLCRRYCSVCILYSWFLIGSDVLRPVAKGIGTPHHLISQMQHDKLHFMLSMVELPSFDSFVLCLPPIRPCHPVVGSSMVMDDCCVESSTPVFPQYVQYTP